MTVGTARPPGPGPGLCERCEHARKIVSGKGSLFWRCAMADQVAGWPKYPPLPVLRCPHYRAQVGA